MHDPHGVIVFFDGGCGLCHGLVRFILARDRAGVFRFAALDSPAAQARLGSGAAAGDSVVVAAGGRLYTHGDAVLEIVRRLPAPWSWARVGRWLPRAARDGCYRLVAGQRHRWRRDPACLRPRAEWRGRFLDPP
jgi:predicted DCC family thiol-disulfide oxidoreductase YuxK